MTRGLAYTINIGVFVCATLMLVLMGHLLTIGGGIVLAAVVFVSALNILAGRDR